MQDLTCFLFPGGNLPRDEPREEPLHADKCRERTQGIRQNRIENRMRFRPAAPQRFAVDQRFNDRNNKLKRQENEIAVKRHADSGAQDRNERQTELRCEIHAEKDQNAASVPETKEKQQHAL